MNVGQVEKALTSVTKKYTKMRKREERARGRYSNRNYYMYSTRITVKEVAWEVMGQAYLKASANGTLPAHARQIMYAARGPILAKCDKDTFDDGYFTQVLLPDYIEEHGCGWNVVYDARGHLMEPHTDEEIGIGTLGVRSYVSRWHEKNDDEFIFNEQKIRYPTKGPANRFGAVLFVEKEGFFPLFEEVNLAERWDIAIMSCKGMASTAGRSLIGSLGVPVYVIHDFDKAGFSIVGTIQRGTRRYRTGCHNAVDMGIRMEDVEKYDLGSEPVGYNHDPSGNMRLNGATPDEIAFLQTQRVELNAFSSDQLIEWIESKLKEHGVEKLIPDASTLKAAYRRAAQATFLNAHLEDLSEQAEEHAKNLKLPPGGLATKVAAKLKESPKLAWDDAVAALVPTVDLADEGGAT